MSELTPLLQSISTAVHHATTEDATLTPIGIGAVSLLSRLAILSSPSQNPQQSDHLKQLLKRCDDLLHFARCKLHAFPYRDVPECWRRLWTDTSLVKAVLQVRVALAEPDEDEQREDDWEASVVVTLDMALIMAGASGEGRRRMIDELLTAVHTAYNAQTSSPKRSPKRRKITTGDEEEEDGDLFPRDIPTDTIAKVELTSPLPTMPAPPTITAFQSHLDGASTPLHIQKAIPHWPALTTRPWASTGYLLSLTSSGKRLVPIELGSSYTAEGWTQKIIPFREFLHTHILSPSSGAVAYLAQHNLFSQIPALRADISIPDYCFATTPPAVPGNIPIPPQKLEEPALNAWFGPAGTVSPLHTDPYANVLVQVVGAKYIRLYAPEETESVYPRGVEGGVDMSNTSAVDVDGVEGYRGEDGEGREREFMERWPRFREARFVECVLREGEALFIPAGWWHYVRALSTSFSVSFWWN